MSKWHLYQRQESAPGNVSSSYIERNLNTQMQNGNTSVQKDPGKHCEMSNNKVRNWT